MYTFVESLAISLHLVYLLIALSSTTASGTSFISIFHFDRCDIVICLFFFHSLYQSAQLCLEIIIQFESADGSLVIFSEMIQGS